LLIVIHLIFLANKDNQIVAKLQGIFLKNLNKFFKPIAKKTHRVFLQIFFHRKDAENVKLNNEFFPRHTLHFCSEIRQLAVL